MTDVNDDDLPATKGDLRKLRGELGRHVRAFEELSREMIRAIDDKHTGRSDALRTDLDAHVADAAAHRAPRRRVR